MFGLIRLIISLSLALIVYTLAYGYATANYNYLLDQITSRLSTMASMYVSTAMSITPHILATHFATMTIFVYDKICALVGFYRVPEPVLLYTCWHAPYAAMLTMMLTCHKTKFYFVLLNLIAIANQSDPSLLASFTKSSRT